jgi:hypothetical protein
MTGQIKWHRYESGVLRLVIRNSELEPWESYTSPNFQHVFKPDFQIDGVKSSKGFATAQNALKMGYVYIQTDN